MLIIPCLFLFVKYRVPLQQFFQILFAQSVKRYDGIFVIRFIGIQGKPDDHIQIRFRQVSDNKYSIFMLFVFCDNVRVFYGLFSVSLKQLIIFRVTQSYVFQPFFRHNDLFRAQTVKAFYQPPNIQFCED